MKTEQIDFPQMCMSEVHTSLGEGCFWKVERWPGAGERALTKLAPKFRSPHSVFLKTFYCNPQYETHFTSQPTTFMH